MDFLFATARAARAAILSPAAIAPATDKTSATPVDGPMQNLYSSARAELAADTTGHALGVSGEVFIGDSPQNVEAERQFRALTTRTPRAL
jgi:hypothetical protein